MKAGLFLTDAKLWSVINDRLRDRADDASDVIRDTYEETTNRLDNARSAIRGESHWIRPVSSFVGGIGIGIGVGMLLAPVSGEEARAAIRDRAVDMKKRAVDMSERVSGYASSGAPRFRSSTETASTGTEGD
jgi:hypothetical protein